MNVALQVVLFLVVIVAGGLLGWHITRQGWSRGAVVAVLLVVVTLLQVFRILGAA
ncbi:MAG: hypothetical protein IT305_29860 [Chloroflexi bacterium]|nr:hypothetical protein [Chloroflexota bacterium]